MVWRGFLSDGAIWFHVLPLLLSPEWKKSNRNFNHISTISYVNYTRIKIFISPPKLRSLISTASQYYKNHTNSISQHGTKISQPSPPFNDYVIMYTSATPCSLFFYLQLCISLESNYDAWQFARAIAQMPRFARAIAMNTAIRASDRDDSAIRKSDCDDSEICESNRNDTAGCKRNWDGTTSRESNRNDSAIPASDRDDSAIRESDCNDE